MKNQYFVKYHDENKQVRFAVFDDRKIAKEAQTAANLCSSPEELRRFYIRFFKFIKSDFAD